MLLELERARGGAAGGWGGCRGERGARHRGSALGAALAAGRHGLVRGGGKAAAAGCAPRRNGDGHARGVEVADKPLSAREQHGLVPPAPAAAVNRRAAGVSAGSECLPPRNGTQWLAAVAGRASWRAPCPSAPRAPPRICPPRARRSRPAPPREAASPDTAAGGGASAVVHRGRSLGWLGAQITGRRCPRPREGPRALGRLSLVRTRTPAAQRRRRRLRPPAALHRREGSASRTRFRAK